MKIKHSLFLSALPFILCSCGPVSSYKATVLITSNQTNSCSISFADFEGTYVFKGKKLNPGEGTISYTASLGEGTIDVSFIAFTEEEQALFTINGGESINGNKGYIEKGYRVKIILRSLGKAKNGKFTFELN